MSQTSPTAVTPGNRTATLIVLYLGLFLFAYTVPLAGLVKEQISASLHLAQPEDSWPIFPAFFLAWLLIVPPGAWLADVIGRKPLLLLGSLLLTVGMVGLSYAESLTQGCIAQFLIGAGGILLQIVGIAAVTDLYANSRGSALNIAVGLVGIFALLSPVLLGKLMTEYGWAWNDFYRYSAVLPALVFMLQLFSTFPSAPSTTPVGGGTLKRLLTDPGFLLLIAAMFVYGIVEQGISTWASSYMGQELGTDKELQAWVISGFWIIASLVRLLVGLFGWVDGVSYPKQVVLSALAAAACLALATLPHNSTMAAIFFSLCGAAIALIWPSIMTYAAQYSGAPATTVFGLIVGIGGALGVMTGSSVLGLIKKLDGMNYERSLLTLILPLAALAIIFATRRSDAKAKS